MDSVEGISTRILLAILMEHTIVRDKFLGMVVESSTHRMPSAEALCYQTYAFVLNRLLWEDIGIYGIKNLRSLLSSVEIRLTAHPTCVSKVMFC